MAAKVDHRRWAGVGAPEKKEENQEDKSLDKKLILETEKRLRGDYEKKKKNLVLLVSKISGTQVEGLFTTKRKANVYKIRVGINLSCEVYNDTLASGEVDQLPPFYDYAKKDIAEYY